MKSEFVGRWEQYWDSTKEECVSPFHDSIRSFQGEGWGVALREPICIIRWNPFDDGGSEL